MRPLTATEKLRAQIGLSPSAHVRVGLPPDAWHRWDEDYGPWFRQQHALPPLSRDAARIEAEPPPDGELPLPPGL